MSKVELSFKEIVKESWKIVKLNYGVILGAFAISALVQVVLNILQKYGPTNFIFVIVMLILSVFFGTLIAIGMTHIGLKLVRGQSAHVRDVYSHTEPFLRYLVTSVFRSLITLAGLILLVVPGIIWGIKYMYSIIVVVDKNIAPRDALRLSGKITDGYKMKLFLFGFAFLGLNILGAIALVVGLLVTIPITFIGMFVIYDKLLKQAHIEIGKNIATEA